MRISELVASMLLDTIKKVAAKPEACARRPGKDFTRMRKIGLDRLLTLLVCWEQDTITAELGDMEGWDGNTPTASALIQQWAKLNDKVMPTLLYEFLSRFIIKPYHEKYRLYAADGTELQLLPGTGGDTCRVRNGHGEGQHSELHVTCVYDLIRHTFEDAVCQGGAKENEPAALCTLVDRTDPGENLRSLWLADRNFCTWNVISHMINAGAAFCLREKDTNFEYMLGDTMPEGEFDVQIERCVMRTRSSSAKTRPDEAELYRYMRTYQPFDALQLGSHDEWWCQLRLVRIALPPGADGDPDQGDRWLNLVTNLDENEFSSSDLAALYSMRWGEESGFLHLKHTVGMSDPRTRDLNRAEQELWGRLVLYDACSLGVSGVPEPQRGRKHARATNRTDAFKAFMRMLRSMVRRVAYNVEAFAARMSHSIRPDRGHKRRPRPKSPPKSCYRH